MRPCFFSPSDYTIRIKVVGGLTKYVVEGPGAYLMENAVEYMNRSYKNASFYFAKDNQECEERMMNNLSDVSNALSVTSQAWIVPIPMFTDKTTIMSGYNMTHVEQDETASALANFTLFDLEVYLCSLHLAVMLILVVAGRIAIHIQHRKHALPRGGGGRARLAPQDELRHALSRVVNRIYDGSTNRFKFISLLLTLLLFWLTTFFNSVYQTSQVVSKEPTLITSYSELIAHETGFPIFLDALMERAYQFKNADSDSLYGRVWQKFEQLDVSLRHIWKQLDLNFIGVAVNTSVTSMFINKSVTIQAQGAGEILQTFFCCSSPVNQLWRFVLNYDESEEEVLVGYPVSPFLTDDRPYLELRKVYEVGLYIWLRRDKTLMQQLATMMAGTADNATHLKMQVAVCSEDYHQDSVNDVDSLPFQYYKWFLLLLLGMLAAAFIALAVEMLLASVEQQIEEGPLHENNAPLFSSPRDRSAVSSMQRTRGRVNARPKTSR